MKSIKVFFNGKRLRDIYPHATAWQVFKYRVRQFFRKLILLSFSLLGLYVTFTLGSKFAPDTIYAVQEKQIVVNTLNDKIDEIKEEALDALKACESSKYGEDDGIIIFDSNNKASIGLYQFQKATVIHYYKTIYDKDITPKEAVLIALDESRSRQLAKDIIFGVKNGEGNWYNCSQKIGLSQTVSIVNKLSK